VNQLNRISEENGLSERKKSVI